MNKILNYIVLSFSGILIAALIGCGNDDGPTPVNEEEVITTVRLTFTPEGGGVTQTASWSDPDGDGGNDPVVEGITLNQNTTYQLGTEFLNESVNPTEDITVEVAEEAEEHQVFYEIQGGGAEITYSDSDSNGNPIGLANSIAVGSAGTFSITVTLRHEPNKEAAGVSDGEIFNAGGETDVETNPPFPVSVQP